MDSQSEQRGNALTGLIGGPKRSEPHLADNARFHAPVREQVGVNHCDQLLENARSGADMGVPEREVIA